MGVIYREITPLTESDCFTVLTRQKKEFNFPLHYHEEFELNFIMNAGGAKRIAGDSIEVINDLELVLIGPNLSHAWFTHQCKSEAVYEITIQFHKDLFDDKFLQRNQSSFIKNLLEQSTKGILFSEKTALQLKPQLLTLNEKNGFQSVLELINILHELSISQNMRTLSTSSFVNEHYSYNSRRIAKIFEYIQENYNKNMTLGEAAKLANMTEVSLSRFIKKRTGKTFIESLNEIRLGHATRMLIDTTNSIAEISFKCGFNNLSYFNRIFKKRRGCTPKEFRENYSGNRRFI